MTVTTAGMQHRIPFDPYDYDFHEDPYPTYARLRAEAPVYRNTDGDFWALARHEDVADAFRDNVRLSNSWGVSMDPASYNSNAEYAMSFLAMDDPRHLRLRKLVSKGFTPRRVSELAPRITELTAKHWDRCLQMGEFDFVHDFAGLLPMDVVSELLGVGEADRAHLRKQSDLLIHREEGVTDVPPAAIHAYLDLHGFYTSLLAERRKNPGDDLISALTAAELVEGGERTALTDQEIIGFMMLMVVAGNETTTKLLANSIFWGAQSPDQVASVIAASTSHDDALDAVTPWVQETLRYDTSTQMLLRRVLEDVEYGGKTIPAGDRVLLLVGSANRDEEVFGPDADQYRIGRESSRTILSFGLGTHFCLGAHLARLETEIGLAQIARTVRSFDVDVERSVRVHSVNVRGFADLPMTVKAR
ncbi:cytochrome P450 [Gordonia sp. PDNC005]|uniref:cytochrome P450 n=1 Tax=unclassified Gordonia (in: high G+C Gram-positive bacteria) TaxID=2657482 RepID=UPI0019622B7C|nr:cytochrome P450 [Gordonia sp. PDNC005]QRY61662.1 cytochrome P450 [Gordonia sp. PDNC005]